MAQLFRHQSQLQSSDGIGRMGQAQGASLLLETMEPERSGDSLSAGQPEGRSEAEASRPARGGEI